MVHRRVARALDALVKPHTALPQEVLSPDKASGTPAKPLCQPWSREDYTARLSSFKVQWWFAKPACLSPVECAKTGWRNVGRDLLGCEVCGVTLTMSTPVTMASDQGTGDTVATRLAASLGTAHATHCGWRENPCWESIIKAPEQAPEVVLAVFKARYESIAAAGLRPALGGSIGKSMAVSLLAKDCTRYPEQCAAVLALAGWEAQGMNLYCAACHRTISSDSFAMATDASQPFGDATPQAKRQRTGCVVAADGSIRLDPLREHRYYCQWSKGRISKDGKSEPPGWEVCSAALAPVEKSGQERPSPVTVAASVQSMLRVFQSTNQV